MHTTFDFALKMCVLYQNCNCKVLFINSVYILCSDHVKSLNFIVHDGQLYLLFLTSAL